MRRLIMLAAVAASLIVAAPAAADNGGGAQQGSWFGSFFGPIPSCTAAIGWQGIVAGCAQPGAGPAFLAWFGGSPGWPH